MHWILILFITGLNIASIEFDSQDACEDAGKAVLKLYKEDSNSPDNNNANYYCAKR